jgi:hypothetical protein
MPFSKQALARLAALLVVLTGGGAIAITVTTGEQQPRTVTIQVPPVVPKAVAVDSNGDGNPNKVLELDTTARRVVEQAARAPERFDLAGDLRGLDNTPVGQLDAPLASPNWPGCSTRMLPTNYSNRTSHVRAIGLHYTAGANQPGLSDMNGLTAYASSPRAGVSWHFLIDAEGHCYYSVPVGKKAWTIGNLNSQTVNIEVIGRGNERAYPAATAGARKLAQVVQRIGRLYRIPMRLGATSGCSVTRSGIITHWQGGPCSGGHHDIKPYKIDKVVQTIATDRITSTDRATCANLNAWRRAGRPAAQSKVNVKRRRALEGRGVTCTPSGPRRR